jgi:hypothetical protein
MRVMSLALVFMLSALSGALAQQHLELPLGRSVGSGIVTAVGRSHSMTFIEHPPGQKARTATGTYEVTAGKGGEIHARFTVASLTDGGRSVTSARMLGQTLTPGARFRFSMRLEEGEAWSLTVFDKDIQPTFSREMTRRRN